MYAASTSAPPFDELSSVCALAPYGREKLAQEDLFSRLQARAIRRFQQDFQGPIEFDFRLTKMAKLQFMLAGGEVLL